MTSSSTKQSLSQWRWDRFDARKGTSVAWASRNCVGKNSNMLSSHQAMQRRVIQDEKAAVNVIVSELHQLLHDAANITGMTCRC
jgi:N-dimethylarginine dimethylaminohydrolase